MGLRSGLCTGLLNVDSHYPPHFGHCGLSICFSKTKACKLEVTVRSLYGAEL